MKKIVLWLMSTLTVLVLLFGYHTSTSSTSAAAVVQGGNASASTPVQGGTASGDTFSTSGGPLTSSSASSPSPAGTAPSPSPSRASASRAAGTSAASAAPSTVTVTGAVASTRYGPVQVKVTVSNRKLTNVAVVQYPNGNGRDQEINGYALPILIQETLKAQSSKIDMVSGATYTSDGYITSLQSALDKAGI